MEEHVHVHALAGQDRAEKSCQYKGIRLRKWGSWVSEIRMPRSRDKLWLGSYKTAQQAARAYDAAVCCLRGPNARLNFPTSVPSIPSASSLSRHEIQLAAARYARLDQLSYISPSAHANDDNKAMKNPPSPSRSVSVQETVSLMNGQHQQEQEHEMALWESFFAGSDDCLAKNLESLASTDEASALNLIPIPRWEEQHNTQQETNNFFHHRGV